MTAHLSCNQHTLPSGSSDRMAFVRDFVVPFGGMMVWFLGQNGFLLKTSAGLLIAIDPYLTNSVATGNPSHRLDLSRVLPAPLEACDLKVDYVIFTHSHGDHLDLETVAQLPGLPRFVAPWDAHQSLIQNGYETERVTLLHPGQRIQFHDLSVTGVFAIPTDTTDLNHIGVLLQTHDGPSFYNTGDTAYAEHIKSLLPVSIDLCAICINGGFHNLTHAEAARIVQAIAPRIVVPTHFDLMACNRSDPEMFRIALQNASVPALYRRLSVGHVYLFQKVAA